MILSGSLDVTCKSDMRHTVTENANSDGKREIVVGGLSAGDFFGESSLLESHEEDKGHVPLTSTASVLSTTQCLFIYFDTNELRERLNAMPEVMEKIDTYIKNRLTGQLLAMGLSLFQAMRPASVALFTANLIVHTYSEGEYIMKKGDKGTDFFVLIQGSVRVTDGDGVNVVLDKKGDYFGELALIREEPRAASVNAVSGTTIARISGNLFKKLCLN